MIDVTSRYLEALEILNAELSTRSYSRAYEVDGDDLHLTYQENFIPDQDCQHYLRTIVFVVPNQDENLSAPIREPISVSIIKKAISPETGRDSGQEHIIESDFFDLGHLNPSDDKNNLSETIRDYVFARLSNWLQ